MTFIRTSEERDFKRCPQRWDWAWRQGLRTRGEEKEAFWFGTGVHLALGLWYCGPGAKRGPHPAETWDDYAKAYFGGMKLDRVSEEEEAKAVSLHELGLVLMNEYVKKYGEDSHKLYIQAEQTFAVDIPWPKVDLLELKTRVDRGDIMATWVGTMDGVWRHAETGRIWLDEHKTAKVISTGHLTLDPQASKYWAVAAGTLKSLNLIGPDDTLAGIQYNFIRKALPDERPRDSDGYATNKPTKAHYQTALDAAGYSWTKKDSLEELAQAVTVAGLRVTGERSKIQPSPIFERFEIPRTRRARVSILKGMQDSAYLMAATRSGLLPVTITPNKDCDWECSFFTMCELKQETGDTSESFNEYRRLQYVETDPYADHHEAVTEN